MIEGVSPHVPGHLREIKIRDVTDPARLQDLVHLQAQIWPDDPLMPVPAHLMAVIGSSGGIVLGAHDGDQVVGFALGILARSGPRLYHASHMVGIHPAYQGTGIGARIKEVQRERALAQGLDLMTWTFDPLEARNAYFNVHKLGATARHYKENVYGAMQDALNRGLPSDRLLVEWYLPTPRDPVPPSETYPLLRSEGDRPVLDLDGEFRGGDLSIAVPAGIQDLKRADPALALEWRLVSRRAFTWAFARGYRAVDFTRGTYILTLY